MGESITGDALTGALGDFLREPIRHEAGVESRRDRLRVRFPSRVESQRQALGRGRICNFSREVRGRSLEIRTGGGLPLHGASAAPLDELTPQSKMLRESLAAKDQKAPTRRLINE